MPGQLLTQALATEGRPGKNTKVIQAERHREECLSDVLFDLIEDIADCSAESMPKVSA